MPKRLKEFFRSKNREPLPSSSDTSQKGELVAGSHSANQPGDLSSRGEDSVQAQVGNSGKSDDPGSDGQYGTTILSDSGSDSQVDLVFVHGLTGKSMKTWRNAKTEFSWPTEIAKDIGPSRVITFGYDVDVTSFFGHTSKSRLGEHAQDLIGDLARLRDDTDTETRPIIFITHSMGGLVVQKALSLSRARAASHLRAIEKCTIAIAFLGTPHAGSDLATWAGVGTKLIGTVRDVNKDILRTLERESETLRDTQENFGQLLESRKDEGTRIQITCFYEQLAVTGVGQIVPISSATLLGYDSYGIHANHMDMTKFANNKDKNYIRVLGEIKRWMKNITKPSNKPAVNPELAKYAEDCIKSLFFPEIEQRQSTIDEAHPQTFTWFWSRRTTGIHDWLAKPCGLYWVQGTPGSGKSTLMKFIAQSHELSELLCCVSPDQSYAIAFYSFFVQSSATAGSIDGMLRSLLWQLMQTLPNARTTVLEQFRKIKANRPEVSWRHEELHTALLAFLQDSKYAAICILIDGLDEYHGKDEVIARYIDKLAALLPSHVRLCVASRPYPDFAFQFHDVALFKVQEQTAKDIRAYVHSRFRETALSTRASYDELAAIVIGKAHGSFLWVRLACDELQRNWRKFQSNERLESCLKSLPSELNQLYLQIFKQLDADEIDDLSRMLTILVSCYQPLTIVEFCHVFDLNRQDSDPSTLQLLQSQLRPLLTDLARRLRIPQSCRCNIEEHLIKPRDIEPRRPNSSTKEARHSNHLIRSPSITNNALLTNREERALGNTDELSSLPSSNGEPSDDSFFYVSEEEDSELNSRYARRPFRSDIEFFSIVPESTINDVGSQEEFAQACPHTAAYTCHSDKTTAEQWYEDARKRIEMIGRGLLHVSNAFVSLSHETVANFWEKEVTSIWGKPLWYGQELLLHACISYLDVLATNNILPMAPLGYALQARICLHYPFLEHALWGFGHYLRTAEQMSESSQACHLRKMPIETLRYWQTLIPSWPYGKPGPLVLHGMPDLCVISLAKDLYISITRNDLILGLVSSIRSDQHVFSSWIRGALIILDFIWLLGNDPTIDDELDSLCRRTGANNGFRPYGNAARIQSCIEICHRACQMDKNLRKSPSSDFPTTRFNIPRNQRPRGTWWDLDDFNDIRCYSFLETTIFVQNDKIFDVVLSFAGKVPLVTGRTDTALIVAAYESSERAVKSLLKTIMQPNNNVVDVCRASEGGSHNCPALAAVLGVSNEELQDSYSRRARILRRLLVHGADPMADLDAGMRARQADCHMECFERIKTLADANSWQSTPFLAAILHFSIHRSIFILNIICWLFQCGADLHQYSMFSEQFGETERFAWEWLEHASRRFYIPRGSDRPEHVVDLGWLESDDPFVDNVVNSSLSWEQWQSSSESSDSDDESGHGWLGSISSEIVDEE